MTTALEMTATHSVLQSLSLGAGVQSSTLALMAAAGNVEPMPDCGIFADTQAEPKSVYVWLDWLEKQLPFPVYRVTKGSLEKDTLTERVRKDGLGSWVPSGIPHYSTNTDGSKGHGPRQCTHDFKLIPLEQKQRALAGKPDMLKWRQGHRSALKLISGHEKALAIWKRLKKEGVTTPTPEHPDEAWDECQADPLVIAWIGISLDEATRMKPSRTPWIKNRYPLIELRFTRKACLKWMEQHQFPTPPRSACVFCPYHSDDEWIRLRDEEPEDFQRAVLFDRLYREAKVRTVSQKGFKPFLHDSRVPLDKVIFEPSRPDQQMQLFDNECLGMCGV